MTKASKNRVAKRMAKKKKLEVVPDLPRSDNEERTKILNQLLADHEKDPKKLLSHQRRNISKMMVANKNFDELATAITNLQTQLEQAKANKVSAFSRVQTLAEVLVDDHLADQEKTTEPEAQDEVS